MAYMKAPENVTFATTSDGNRLEVVDGFIDTTNVGAIAQKNLEAHGFRAATDEEITAADKETVVSGAVQHAQRSKADVIRTLADRGIHVDGRSSLAALEKRLEESDHAEAARKKAADQEIQAEADKRVAEAEEAQAEADAKKAREDGKSAEARAADEALDAEKKAEQAAAEEKDAQDAKKAAEAAGKPDEASAV